jgi:hypothetical protein
MAERGDSNPRRLLSQLNLLIPQKAPSAHHAEITGAMYVVMYTPPFQKSRQVPAIKVPHQTNWLHEKGRLIGVHFRITDHPNGIWMDYCFPEDRFRPTSGLPTIQELLHAWRQALSISTLFVRWATFYPTFKWFERRANV